jgi:hypothetical protein
VVGGGRAGATHVHDRRHALAVELERVADEVLQEAAHLRGIGFEARERADLHAPAGVLDARLEVGAHRGGDLLQRDRLEGMAVRPHAREVQ